MSPRTWFLDWGIVRTGRAFDDDASLPRVTGTDERSLPFRVADALERGHELETAGLFVDAEAVYRAAMQRDDLNRAELGALHLALGRLMAGTGRVRDAILHGAEALRLRPYSDDAHEFVAALRRRAAAEERTAGPHARREDLDVRLARLETMLASLAEKLEALDATAVTRGSATGRPGPRRCAGDRDRAAARRRDDVGGAR